MTQGSTPLRSEVAALLHGAFEEMLRHGRRERAGWRGEDSGSRAAAARRLPQLAARRSTAAPLM